jgi:ketosteroid isomerase-like protein
MFRAIIFFANQDSIAASFAVDRVPNATEARFTAGTRGERGAALAIPSIRVRADEDILRAAYAAFNARDVEAAVALMHPEVDWPNAWQGGRVVGRDAVAAYWRSQFDAISSTVEPERFTRNPDGTITATVHQVVHDARTSKLQSDTHVRHRYQIKDGSISRMDVEAAVP